MRSHKITIDADTSLRRTYRAAVSHHAHNFSHHFKMQFSSFSVTFLIAMAMSKPICHSKGLSLDVFHLPPEPVLYQNSTSLTFSPTSFSLISGHHNAILVDAPATSSQAESLLAWLETTIPHKGLSAIYITHGHGDHFFSANIIANRYNAKIYATSDTAAHVAQQYSEPFYTSFWGGLFGDKLPKDNVVPNIINGGFELEGHEFHAVEVGQGDTYNSTVLWVPDLELVVGGDVVYGDCHQLFAEDNTPELRGMWLKSLEKVKALKPKVVVPSHQTAGNGYGVEHIADTKRYIEYYESVVGTVKSWEELEEKMKAQFPERDGSFILRWSCQAPFGADF